MRTLLFDETFQARPNDAYPDGWQVEQHTDRLHAMGAMRDGAFHITYPGNKHLPLIPPVRDFRLDLVCRAGTYSAQACLYLFFRYDSDTQAGYLIRHGWNRGVAETLFGVYDRGAFHRLGAARAAGADPVAPMALSLEARAQRFALRRGDLLLGEFEDPQNLHGGPGRLAFDTGRHKDAYDFRLASVRVATDDPIPESPLWPALCVAWPEALGALTVPFWFTLESAASPARTVLRAALTGGPCARPPSVIDFRGLYANVLMRHPYLRLELPGGRALGPFFLFRGAVGLREHWNPMSSGFPPADAECPVGRTLYLPPVPPGARVAFGIEHAAAEDRLALAGGPWETIVEAATGRSLYAGPALAPGAAVVEIESPPDKAICQRLPKTAARYAQALVFARANHFFLEPEPARFSLRFRHRDPALASAPLRARWTLETVFREVADPPVEAALRAQIDGAAGGLRAGLGVETLTSDPVAWPDLAPGVYHVRAEILQGDSRVGDLRRAFEVLSADPAAPAPPILSGLPELYPLLPDFASEADGFDPWAGAVNDTCHYLAGNCVQPLVARERRSWELVHFYRRRWLLWLHARTTPNPALEDNADLLPHADLVYPYTRWDLWKIETYRVPDVRGALLEFLRSPGFRPAPGGALDAGALARDGGLAPAAFEDLVRRHWKPWTAWFNRWFVQSYLAGIRRTLDRLNSPARLMHYDVYPPYGSVYKAAYFPTYMGHDLAAGIADVMPGPMIWEDYPYMCGYPLQRGVFQLAALKMAVPDWPHYPEIYGVNGCAGDSHVVYGSPPYGTSNPPPGYFAKTVFEYACAAAWFDGRAFRFWDDRGFQAMCWDRAHFDEFLDAWKFVARHPPERPLRTTAFLCSRAACDRHPDRYVPGPPDITLRLANPWGDMINTAEEATAFAYEQARLDGQLAGFLADPERLEGLDPADVDTLVLPPLAGVPESARRAVRALHERGVNLLGIEDVTGLEDLFGLRPLERPAGLARLRVAPGAAPLAALHGLVETCSPDDVRAGYALAGAAALIEGADAGGQPAAPALVAHRTRWGLTACWTIAPTLVRRADYQGLLACYGKESISELVNRATALVLRHLGRPRAETTEGKLIAFRDRAGRVHAIVIEDAHPLPARPIRPVVTLRLPGVTPARLACTLPFEILACEADHARVRLRLDPHQSAILTVSP